MKKIFNIILILVAMENTGVIGSDVSQYLNSVDQYVNNPVEKWVTSYGGVIINHYAPRHVSQICKHPCMWGLMLCALMENEILSMEEKTSLLADKLHLVENKAAPIVEMFFDHRRTQEEQRTFIQNSLHLPEMIDFLGKIPLFMDEVGLDGETRERIVSLYEEEQRRTQAY